MNEMPRRNLVSEVIGSGGSSPTYDYDLVTTAWSTEAGMAYGFNIYMGTGDSITPNTYKGLTIREFHVEPWFTVRLNLEVTQVPGATEITVIVEGVLVVLTWSEGNSWYQGTSEALYNVFSNTGVVLAATMQDNGP